MTAYINTIGAAVPEFRIPQREIAKFMQSRIEYSKAEAHDLEVLYRASGIYHRYSVVGDFNGMESRLWKERQIVDLATRMRIYEEKAPQLALAAIESGIAKSDLDKVTHLITISCTGMYAPGLDIDLIRLLGLNTSTQRSAINFMGCYGAFNGLKLAKSIVEADPSASVLVVSVELCTLHFQPVNSPDATLAQSLFSDGAAACMVSSKPSQGSLELSHFNCDIVFDGHHEMSWKIGQNAFDMALTANVPALIREQLDELIAALLAPSDYTTHDIGHFALHPGGKRILREIESALNIDAKDNRHAHEVLRNFGNMSSATVLFVLKSLMDAGELTDRPILSMAFGPGLTMESMILEPVNVRKKESTITVRASN